MKEIETFNTVHLYGDFSGSISSVRFNINIPFEVDEIILKYVNFINNAGDPPNGPEMSIVQTNLINDAIFTFP